MEKIILKYEDKEYVLVQKTSINNNSFRSISKGF